MEMDSRLNNFTQIRRHPESGRTRPSKSGKKKDPTKGNVFDPDFTREALRGSRLLNSAGCVHKEDDKDKLKLYEPSSKLKCSICMIYLEDYLQQRVHFKTDWHIFNVRQKVCSKETVDEATFIKTEFIGDSSDSETEVINTKKDNLSNSDHEEDENPMLDQKAKIHFVTADKKLFSVHKCLLDSSKELCRNCILLESSFKNIMKDGCWIIMMFSGGHFAAAVFHKMELIEHKAIHRYTVRAKSGTIQSARDSKQNGRTPRSAGATIRRQNEATLVLEIQDVLRKWKEHIDHADKIFLTWPQSYRSVIFGGKSPAFEKSDSRFRKIPFMTGKPTFGELKRIQEKLTTIKLHEMFRGIEKLQTDSDSVSEEEELVDNFRSNINVSFVR